MTGWCCRVTTRRVSGCCGTPGSALRWILLASCTTLKIVPTIERYNPALGTVTKLANLPTSDQVCDVPPAGSISITSTESPAEK